MTYIIALGIGVGIFAVSMWAIRLLATPGPEEVDPEAVEEVTIDYKCTVCGLRLTVTHAQADDEVTAPRHCREPMDVSG
ncbi:MAG: hypothetical protein GY720_09425 [bacterium]|nr:hypothetical protein [bacterium]